MEDAPDVEWLAMLDWLTEVHGMGPVSVRTQAFAGAGRGLVVSRAIPHNIYHPPPALFAIPSSALLNANTLRPLYPPSFAPVSLRRTRSSASKTRVSSSKSSSKSNTPAGSPPGTPPVSSAHLPLSSTQLVTLHLALHNPNSITPLHPSLSADPWAPYLACCPKDFDHHPLTWIVDTDETDHPSDESLERTAALTELADCLPLTTKALVDQVNKRFRQDVEILRDVVRLLPDLPICPEHPSPLLTLDNLLWAWLSYNTRCLSYPLQLAPSTGENDHTMSPIVDLANHSVQPTPTPYLLPQDVSPAKATHYALPAPEGRKMEEGEEIFLQYGGHPEGFLMAEYGFASGSWEGQDGNGRNEWDEVGLDAEVELMFDSLGPEGVKKREILEKEGYWANYTLHSHPAPAHPSHRLLPALRLYHTSLSSTPPSATSRQSGSLSQWRDTLLGLSPDVSPENEALTRKTLVSLCDGVERDVKAGLDRVTLTESAGLDLWDAGQVGGRQGWLDKCASVRVLWKGMRRIAEEVKESVDADVEF